MDKALRENALVLRQVLSESIAASSFSSVSSSSNTTTPSKQLTIPAKIANCLQSLESVIEQSENKSANCSDSKTAASINEDSIALQSFFNNSRTSSLLDDKLRCDSEFSRVLPNHNKINDNNSNNEQLQRELVHFAEELTVHVLSDKDKDTAVESAPLSLTSLRALRSAALRLSLRVSERTGWNTVHSEDMQSASPWKLLSFVGYICITLNSLC